MTQKLVNLRKKLTNRNHDKYIASSEFNSLAASVFNARLKQANLVAKTDFEAKLGVKTKKLTQINQNIYWLKMK